MTTLRKIQANRANARASTGPKTAPGRARAARNARRHGLSLSVFADPTQSEQVETLAREIAGEPTSDGIYQLARRVAEAQIDLQRVRCARHQFLSGQLANPYCYSLARMREQFSLIRDLLRPNPPDIPLAVLSEYLDTTPPQGPLQVRNNSVGRDQTVTSYGPLRAAGVITPKVCHSRARSCTRSGRRSISLHIPQAGI